MRSCDRPASIDFSDAGQSSAGDGATPADDRQEDTCRTQREQQHATGEHASSSFACAVRVAAGSSVPGGTRRSRWSGGVLNWNGDLDATEYYFTGWVDRCAGGSPPPPPPASSSLLFPSTAFPAGCPTTPTSGGPDAGGGGGGGASQVATHLSPRLPTAASDCAFQDCFQDYFRQARSAGKAAAARFVGAFISERSSSPSSFCGLDARVSRGDHAAAAAATAGVAGSSWKHPSDQGHRRRRSTTHDEDDFFSAVNVAMREIEFGH